MQHDILFFGPWYLMFQRPHHFVRLFEKHGMKTCVVTNARIFSVHPDAFAHDHVASSVRRIKSLPRPRFTKYFSRPYVKYQQRKAFAELAVNIPAILYNIPDILPEKANPLVFDCLDDYASFGNKRDEKRADAEQELAEKADIIWATSKILYDKWNDVFPSKTTLIPNGADVDHFAPAIRRGFGEDQLQKFKGKGRVVYCGAISAWFDWPLLIGAANELPEVQFDLIGYISSTIEHSIPDNVKILGARPYEQLPNFLGEADCCIIPFVINDLIKSTNPVKLFEYFSAGKPVVCSPLPEAMQYQSVGVLETGDNAKSFADAIVRAIEHSQSAIMIEKRLAIAQKNSWEARFKVAHQTLVPFLSIER